LSGYGTDIWGYGARPDSGILYLTLPPPAISLFQDEKGGKFQIGIAKTKKLYYHKKLINQWRKNDKKSKRKRIREKRLVPHAGSPPYFLLQ
jgi:hypothetical protein